jgi:hypothetical protein
MTHVHRIGRVLAAILALVLAGDAAADGVRIGASAGVGSAYGQTYFEVGGRLGYDIGFGVTPEVALLFWNGSTPNFVELAPGITWYLPLPVVRPYVGAFYAHDFVSAGFPDQDALGIRGGIGLFGLGPLYVTIGAAYERRLSCPSDCDTWWPEATAGFNF